MVSKNGWNKLKQIARTQIDVLAMGMILHCNRVSEDILESLFQVLKMGQTDICLWCETDVLWRVLLLLNFYSISYSSVKRKAHMNKINKNYIHRYTFPPRLPLSPCKTSFLNLCTLIIQSSVLLFTCLCLETAGRVASHSIIIWKIMKLDRAAFYPNMKSCMLVFLGWLLLQKQDPKTLQKYPKPFWYYLL